jgi:hypothetical protein
MLTPVQIFGPNHPRNTETSLDFLVAVDGQVFQTDVYSASHPPTQSPRPRRLSRWGGRGIVVLIGIRLGIDGVNPVYYNTIKVCDPYHPFIFVHVRLIDGPRCTHAHG